MEHCWLKAMALLLLFLLSEASRCPTECVGTYSNTYWKGIRGTERTIQLDSLYPSAKPPPPPPPVPFVLMIIQIQGGDIQTANSLSYGSGRGTGNGYKNIGKAGLYEFVVVVSVGGGGNGYYEVTTEKTLDHEYSNEEANRFQAILVPFCNVAIIDNTTVIPAWDGSIGGVLAVLATTIRLGDVSLQGKGFRGGPFVNGFVDPGSYSYSFRDNSSSDVTKPFNGPKGEGFIGTPRFHLSKSTYPNELDCASGAPGNAGGGGNFVDCGAGGGANAGRGGDGRIWAKQFHQPGIGGDSVPTDATSRLFLGM